MDFDFTALLNGGPLIWGVMIGFALGWGLVPQPEWAKKYTDMVKSIFTMFGKGPSDPTPPTKPTSNTA